MMFSLEFGSMKILFNLKMTLLFHLLRFGLLDNRMGNIRIILSSIMPCFSAFLHYHDDIFDDQVNHCPFQENQSTNHM